jgi:hypothetical protein
MNDAPDRPLDHATARIVAELATALLPPLQAAVAAEVEKAIGALPRQTSQAFEETLTVLKQLRVSCEEIVTALNAAKNSIRETSVDVLPSLSEVCGRLNVIVENLSRFVEAANLDETEKLLHTVEVGISKWEGILKAEGRVQTRELSEFSSEVLELTKDMKSSLPQTLKENVEKALMSHGDEWVRSVGENVRALETRLMKIEKLFALLGAFVALCLAAIAATVFM